MKISKRTDSRDIRCKILGHLDNVQQYSHYTGYSSDGFFRSTIDIAFEPLAAEYPGFTYWVKFIVISGKRVISIEFNPDFYGRTDTEWLFYDLDTGGELSEDL